MTGSAALMLPLCAHAQETGDAPPPVPVVEEGVAGRTVYTPADFARFAPRTADDMVNQLPGFSVREEEQGRGLGQASTNVLLNGERLALKSESISDRLSRISAEKVVRIEIVDGATLNIPGLSGPVANIITQSGALSGQFEWSPRFRPGYVQDRWQGGSVSINGAAGDVEYSLALSNPGGTGATRGPTIITAPDGSLTERRFSRLQVINDHPKLAGSLKWNGPGSSVGNLSASYQRRFFDLHDHELRTRPDGADSVKDYDPHRRGYNSEIGGDFEFALGRGRLKLIGLDRYEHLRYREDFILAPVDGSPATGSRYTSDSRSGERIGRGEYSWRMLGGDWQLAAEAAFNRYDGAAQLFDLDPGGTFIEIPFPAGTGGVREDRYEAVLTHSRQLAPNLSLQVGLGGEYSRLSQTGSIGLTRTFRRPKGSASLAWTPVAGLDVSVKLARVVGQLAFDDFLAKVDLDQSNGSAGNVDLVPPQSWELDVEVKKDLGAWGSTTLKLQGRWYSDYIDWIVLPGAAPGELVESRGNIASARLYGVDWISTFNFDPFGWTGAKLDLRVNRDFPNIRDPISGGRRAFSGWNDTYVNAGLRYDIPRSDWAGGLGLEKYHANPYYRLSEVGLEYEGPIYTSAFVENKDVFGLTIRAQVFNLTDGRHIVRRTVYDGYRGAAGVLYREDGDESVGLIYTLSVKGTF